MFEGIHPTFAHPTCFLQILECAAPIACERMQLEQLRIYLLAREPILHCMGDVRIHFLQPVITIECHLTLDLQVSPEKALR